MLCVPWYLWYSRSYRDLEETVLERGLSVDHAAIWRWVQRYAPILNQRIRRELRSPNRSWRVDETYVRVPGSWAYLYRVVDSVGETIDFMLSPNRDLMPAKLLVRLALSGGNEIGPRAVNVDGHPVYARVIAELKQSGQLGRRCHFRTSPYLNNIIEQDHRFINKRIVASLRFRSPEAAWRTIEGYQAVHAIRKGRSDGCQKVLRWASVNSSILFGIAAQRGSEISLHQRRLPAICNRSWKGGSFGRFTRQTRSKPALFSRVVMHSPTKFSVFHYEESSSRGAKKNKYLYRTIRACRGPRRPISTGGHASPVSGRILDSRDQSVVGAH